MAPQQWTPARFGPSLLALAGVPMIAAVGTAALVLRRSRSRAAVIISTADLVFMPLAVQSWQIYPSFSHAEVARFRTDAGRALTAACRSRRDRERVGRGRDRARYAFYYPEPYRVFSGYKPALGREVERVASQAQFAGPPNSAPPEKVISSPAV